ncbi:unnamed protein product [Amoebophrya sp. A25]|nr:unnamed protein product [Amoebophrya sp. A25]|eukprot:GSA25T00026985001.1
MTSSGSSRNQKDKKFMDDVNLLIDTEIEPLVKNIIEQHKGKRISNADGTYSAIRKDVQTKKDAIMKEKNYLLWHWQTKVWNSYQAALLDHQYIRAALTATTLRDTIKPACIERIVRWNNAEIGDGARAAYYKQNKWRDIRSRSTSRNLTNLSSLGMTVGTAVVATVLIVPQYKKRFLSSLRSLSLY